ncbi:hypothetical protein PLESTB_001402300 [Pleodorina starrii]|uniref:EF-hand domain-containing protein n=1 Tax=Pleodorina starrii TaxID=330485 RepID=A0A9W6F751_9CHLO|nr:hypothetical protein PLESTB_001402300 [Pleodorina starrii]
MASLQLPECSADLGNVTGVSDQVARQLARADTNNDGHIDAAELASLVDELLKQRSIKRIYRFVAIGLLVAVLAMVGALSGTTYAIVQLSKETKVTTFGNSSFQFQTTTSGQPAAAGGAALDLSGMTFHPDDSRSISLAGAVTGNGARRRMQEGAAAVSSSWLYIGTLSYDTVALGCSILAQNLNTFPVSTATGGASFLVNGTTIHNVRVLQYTGCSEGNVQLVSALVASEAGLTYYVHCDESTAGCDVWKNITGAAAGSVAADSPPPAASTPAQHRLLLQESEATGPETLVQHISSQGIVAERRKLLSWYHWVCNRYETRYENGYQTTICAEWRWVEKAVVASAWLSCSSSTGSVVHRPVYLFGHREEGGMAPYVHITAAGRTLAATPGHFVPVCVSHCEVEGGRAASMENRRAGDVRVGDVVTVADPVPALAVVTQVEIIRARGAFNPFIRGADLIVDGLRASPHSDWLLDSLAPAWLVPHLSAIYEALLAPVYGLYCIVGPATAEWLAHGLQLAEAGGSAAYGAGYFTVLAGMSVPLTATIAAAVLASSAVSRRKTAMKARLRSLRLHRMPRPSSVFEFGPMVQVGSDYMRGVCTGDNPDAIQACTWTIEEAQGKPKEKKHLFRVEF